MRRIAIEIGPSDPELLAIRVNPLPEDFRGRPALRPVRAIDDRDIGRKPVPVAAPQTSAVIRPVARSLKAACDRLTVVVAEGAGDAGLQSGGVGGVKRPKEF